MKIIGLIAENVKKLSAVEIAPSGAVIEITGKNGNGKTSVLDAIWWALAGAKHIQASPIRRGANEARIHLDLGTIKVTRKFTRKEDDEITTSLVVENEAGHRAPSPQKVLDDLVGALTFDPLEFASAAPAEQAKLLRAMMPDIDFDGVEAANKDDFNKRTELNRQVRTLRAQAAGMEVPIGSPKTPVDESALVAELEQAATTNSEIERKKAARDAQLRKAAQLDKQATDLEADAEEALRRAEAFKNTAKNYTAEAAAIREQLEAEPAIPEPVDTMALVEQIATAKRTNAHVEARQRQAVLTQQADSLEAEAQALTDAIEKRKTDLAASVAAAKLPIAGLSFGENEVLMNGLPFDQASTAEQLRASIAIAMAANPKLRVLRVKHGNDLDDESMKLLTEMVEAADYQCWIEKIAATGKSFVVIEDGAVAAAE